VRGQFYDLLELFSAGGECPETSYVFMGGYVDHGPHSIETFMLLLALKVKYPERITLLRGKHETKDISRCYGLYDECKRKYGSLTVWQYFLDVFQYLPLAALIDSQVFCVHSGLSPEAMTFDKIHALDREHKSIDEGTICDLLFSDPADIGGWEQHPHSISYNFGGAIVE